MMRRAVGSVVRALVALFSVCVVGAAIASTCTQWSVCTSTYGCNTTNGQTNWFATKEDAISAYIDTVMPKTVYTGWGNPGMGAASYSYVWRTDLTPNQYQITQTVQNTCNALGNCGGGGTYYFYTTPTSREGDYCTPQCHLGAVGKADLTDGYNRGLPGEAVTAVDLMPDGTAAPTGYTGVGPLFTESSGKSICVNSCSVYLTGVDASYGATVPTSGGLYRMSSMYSTKQTGGGCIATAAEKWMADPTQPPPACDGTTGYVNGKKVCAPKAGTVLAPGTAPTPQVIAGNPAAGASSAGGTGGTDGGNGGTAPAAGDGTIKMGDGTSITQDPSTPSGTVSVGAGNEQQACGAPGQPKCAIDESGTPSGKDFGADSLQKNKSDWDTIDGVLSGIQDKSNKDTSWTMPSWLPANACTPFHLGTFPAPVSTEITLDLCPHKSTIDAVVSFFWIVSTFLAVVAMMERVTMGPSKL